MTGYQRLYATQAKWNPNDTENSINVETKLAQIALKTPKVGIYPNNSALAALT